MAALDHLTGGCNNAVGALFLCAFGVFFDSKERHFRCAAEDREHGFVAHMINRVITPVAACHHEGINLQDLVKLSPVEPHVRLLGLFTGLRNGHYIIEAGA